MNYANSQEIARALEPVLEDAALALQLAAQARPAVWLQTTAVEDEAEIASGSSKFGGCPDLPAGVAWPERGRYPDHEQRVKPHREDSVAPDSRWRWARPEQVMLFREEALQHIARLERTFPLSFVAQINFAEARSAGTLEADFPESGLLSVFYDLLEQPWGFNPADACALKLIFSEDDAVLERRQQPPALLELPDHCQLAPMACELHACVTALPLESAQWGSQGLELDEEQRDRFVEWWFDDAQNAASSGGEDSGCHRIGGWPTPIQGDMQTECALVAAGHYCGNGDAYADEATRPYAIPQRSGFCCCRSAAMKKAAWAGAMKVRSICGCAATICARVALTGRGWCCSVAETRLRRGLRYQRLRNGGKTAAWRFLLVESEN